MNFPKQLIEKKRKLNYFKDEFMKIFNRIFENIFPHNAFRNFSLFDQQLVC